MNANYKEIFADRHLGPSAEDIQNMLNTIGYNSLDDLIENTVPSNIRLANELKIDNAISEQEFLAETKQIFSKNKVYKTYLGQGYYNTFTPNVILRNILENPGWYTQYTPYQAEISQGRLEALLNYQTMVIDITGMEIANASLLDEATAAAEAMTLFKNANKKNKTAMKFFVDSQVFKQTLDVVQTRAIPLGFEVVVGDALTFEPSNEYFGALIQYPNQNGEIIDYSSFTEKCNFKNVKVCVASDLLALTLLSPPGEWGADCVVGNSQRFGVPMAFGGPHAGFFATKDEYKRQIPGRIIGVSIDKFNNPVLRMALQTREQHIKRQKATSNICTAQVLLSIMAGMYATYHGKEGLVNISGKIYSLADNLHTGLKEIGYKQKNKNFFDTLLIHTESDTNKIIDLALNHQMNFRKVDANHIGISMDETTTLEDVNVILSIFAKAKNTNSPIAKGGETSLNWNNCFVRTSDFMTHATFKNYRIEHEMLRYIKSLENKDISLAHSMISLGSCTMKLNATAEMIPVTWAEVGQMHPFVPANQSKGYLEMITKLEEQLSIITGFEAVSLQPNAGSQGEYAGLLAIKSYLASKGEGQRDIVLIPSSAHGTNPASAVLAGYKVVVTACDEQGNIDVEDLRKHAELHKNNLACLMVTYPSTHGVYEKSIKEVTQIIHDNGGQVYMDGANMNAQVGLTSPGEINADVCHLNLHKTFAIPHGGGGPGVGPIGVAKHLVPFLPGHSIIDQGERKGPTVSAAPWGSAGVLVISYGYIKMLGKNGLKRASEIAILNANYIKAKLADYYPTLYVGEKGCVAHELILDTRHFKASCGIQATDIAKRMMDYGFHAPTLSFPVANTLMIEPTESESKAELDRFCDTLINIKKEIEEIESDSANKEDNVLVNAPHTAIEITSDEWAHPYSRKKAAFPLPFVEIRKIWPGASRINDTYGDRNLHCACIPLSEYATQ